MLFFLHKALCCEVHWLLQKAKSCMKRNDEKDWHRNVRLSSLAIRVYIPHVENVQALKQWFLRAVTRRTFCSERMTRGIRAGSIKVTV